MTREEKIQAIVAAVQTDATLLALMRAAIANSLPDVEDPRLDVLIQILGISQT